MSYRQRREKIYNIPNYLLAAVLIIFIIGFILIWVNLFIPNPYTPIIADGFTKSFHEISNLLIGAMIASIIGLFSSVAIMDLKSEKDRDNLILSFYYELKEMNEKIQQIPYEDLSLCLRWLEIEKNPVYPETGLYYVFRKEMVLLDQPFLDKMLPIYSKITFVEQQWKNVNFMKKLDPDVIKKLQQLKTDLNDFLPLLEAEKKRIE